MNLAAMSRRFRLPQRADHRPATRPNLFEVWVDYPAAMLRRWPIEGQFTAAEVEIASCWSDRQAGESLHAILHRTLSGMPTVIEVFGPDGLVPHCILYPLGHGVQLDEFDGESRVYPSLEAALHSVAPA